MSDEKTSANPEQEKKTSEEHTDWTASCWEMMAKMMAHCGCRPERTGESWAACCDEFFAQQEGQQRA